MPSLAAFQRNVLKRIDSPRARSGFAVYRNTALLGAITAIADNYPTVARLVGEKPMDALAGDYVSASPPDSPILASYGKGFADFLRAHPISEHLPYLADVAAIDRLRVEAHLAADAPQFGLDDLAGLTAEEWSSCRVVLHPATRVGWFSVPAPTIWLAHLQADPGELEPVWKAEGILLTRPDGAVEGSLLGPCEHRVLHGLRLGETVGHAALAASNLYAPSDIGQAFRKLVASGALTSLRRNQ